MSNRKPRPRPAPIPPEDFAIAMAAELPYIQTKAAQFLAVGPDIYRKNDFFGEPEGPLDELDIALLQHGCRQLLEGRGIKAERPLTHLGVLACSALFGMFHFIKVHQVAYEGEDEGRKGLLDQLTLRHMVKGIEVTYWNLCVRGDGATAPPLS